MDTHQSFNYPTTKTGEPVMCNDRPPTYWHVIDEDNGDHIATYTDRTAAHQRATHEAIENGRDWTRVVTF